MSSYSDSLQAYAAAAAAIGNSMSLNQILEMNALEQLSPGNLRCVGQQVQFNGRAIGGCSSDLPTLANCPGFFIHDLICDGSTSFIVDPNNIPECLLSTFSINDGPGSDGIAPGDLIGPGNVSVLNGIITLIQQKCLSLAIIPTSEWNTITALNQWGVIACPADGATLNNLYLNLGVGSQPVFNDGEQSSGPAEWGTIVAQFDGIRTNYMQNQFDTAASFAASSCANADLWATIYSADAILAAPVTGAIAAGGYVAQGVSNQINSLGSLFNKFTNDIDALTKGAAIGVAILAVVVLVYFAEDGI